MQDIQQCAFMFNNMLNIEYNYVIARKGKAVELNVGFNKENFHHLLGLQHLKDIDIARANREKVFDAALTGKIMMDIIVSSRYFDSIAQRFEYFAFFDRLLDSNTLVFRFNSKNNPSTRIEAEFLLQTLHLATGEILSVYERRKHISEE